MARKISTILTAMVVVFAMMPALAASAAVAATATLTSGASVLPGANTYTVQLRSNESGFLGLSGTAANYVIAILPPNLKNPACSAATVSGFSCRARGGDSILLEGGSLAPGATLNFSFTADASQPFDRDRVSDIDVRVSENGGSSSTSPAGLLSTRVKALAVVAGSLAPLSPAGVVDGTGTVGQTINYGYQVRNFASQPISVTPALTSNGGESVGTAAAKTIAGNSVATFSVPVTLGTVSGASQSRTFTASATKTGDTNTATGTATGAFTVEASPLLALTANSFSPAHVRSDGSSYTFTINASKANLPGVTGLTGALSFGGNTIALNTPGSLPRNGGALALSYRPSAVTGTDAVLNGTFTFAGTDDNGFAYSQSVTLNNLITIDNINPILTLNLAAPAGQAQVKNGDVLRVTSSVDGGTVDFIQLQATTEDGQFTVFPVTCTAGSTSCNANVTISGLTDYGTISAFGQAKDLALNFGTASSQTFNIDNVLPLVSNPARVVEGAPYGETRNVVEVTIADRYNVTGGCDIASWDIDQTTNDPFLVTAVKYSNGQACASGTNPNDNIRILVPSTNTNLDADVEYNALYFQAGRLGTVSAANRLRDGALSQATDKTVQTVSGIAPALPDLATITRNAGTETSVLSENSFWTRFGGSDAIATIRNTRAGYLIRVLDQNGQLITTTPADDANASTIVPIGNTEGLYVRGLQLVNTSGLLGPVLNVNIALDKTAPGLAGTSVAANGTSELVTVTFNEILWAGANRPTDWFALETNANPGEGGFFKYQPNSISGSQANTRVLDVDLRGNGNYAGIRYAFDSASPEAGNRYEDRAGNTQADVQG